MATYNLVNSIKGGCGKTTFSVILAYYLEESLLIDMDLLGTSMKVLFYGNDKALPGIAHMNDIFQGVNNNSKKFVEKVKFKNGRSIKIVFSSMDCSEKNKFKSGKYSGYSPVVKHSIFRYGVSELLRHCETYDGEKINHFIFDMPPSSDGFSDSAMECIFNPKYSKLKAGDRKNLFMIIGVDWGQTIATINELKSLLLCGDDDEPDGIFLVINNNLGSDSKNRKNDDYNIRKAQIENSLNALSLDQKIKDKIFFLKMIHNSYYTDMGKEGKGFFDLKEEEIKDVFSWVIDAYARYGEDFNDIPLDSNGQDKLKKLILGE